jgi:hypothetical protein
MSVANQEINLLQQVKGTYEINRKIDMYVKLSLVLHKLNLNLEKNIEIYIPLQNIQMEMRADFLIIINKALEFYNIQTEENSVIMIKWIHEEINRRKLIMHL